MGKTQVNAIPGGLSQSQLGVSSHAAWLSALGTLQNLFCSPWHHLQQIQQMRRAEAGG